MSAYRFAADVLEEVARLMAARPELVQVTRTIWIRADKVTAFDAARKG